MARLVLQSFDRTESSAGGDAPVGAVALEEVRLAAFETGYKAGWDDAAAAEADTQGRIGADLARNLQALSFTYHEARGAVLKSLEPLLHEIVAQILPELARATLAETVAERLRPMARAAAGVPVEVTCSAANHETLAQAFAGQDQLPLRLTVEPTLGDGQVYLRFGDTEEQIDLGGAIAGIATAVTDFFETELPKEHQAHG